MLLPRLKKPRPSAESHGYLRASWTVVGLLSGIACGLIFGEYCSVLSLVGDAFVGLLRMTVLPYIVVALIANLGRLSIQQSRRLGAVGGVVLLALWAIGLFTVFLVAHSYPTWKAGSFFSAVLTDPPESVDVIALFIPANIFASLAENHVPAVVVLCICVGLALTSLDNKQALIDQMDVLAAALIRISRFVARWTPIGVFAIAAHTTGTLSWSEMGRMQAYLISYTGASLFVMLIALPWLVAALTPFDLRDVWRVSRVAALTAFATGKLIVVLPILVEETERMLAERNVLGDAAARPAADVLYPLAYPFPHLGKLMGMLFIPFAAWFLGRAVEDHEYPAFLLAGLFSYFGGPILATPFLLDQMHLPHDMFQLFLLTGVYCGRLGDAVGVVHLVTFTLLTTSAFSGRLTISFANSARFLIGTSILGVVMVFALRQGLKNTLKYVEDRSDVLADMQLLEDPVPAILLTSQSPNPEPLQPGEDLLDRIRRRGVIRIGYNEDKLPFAFFNDRGDLVGYDINLAHRLARDLGVTIEFVRFDRKRLAEQLRQDQMDIVMSGLVGTLSRAESMHHTDPYLDVTMALVAPDYRIREFATLNSIQKLGNIKVGYVDVSISFKDHMARLLPNIELVEIASNREYFEDRFDELDALLISAESGAAYTLIYPDFEVAVPVGTRSSVPLIYAVGNRDEEMSDFLEHWVNLRKRDGTMQEMYDHWILGKPLPRPEPRWSLIRYLGWVD